MDSLPLPILSHQQQRGGGSSTGDPTIALPELDLGCIGKKVAKKETTVVAEDDEDPREEAQMIQLLQQVQMLKQKKEKKRKREQVAAKAKAVVTRVRRNASKRADETKLKQNNLAADLRSSMDALRSALQEEAKRATSLVEEQKGALKAAVGALNEKYDEASEVQRQVKVLVECMHQHFRVVHAHIVVEVDGKVAETGEGVCEDEMVQNIHSQTEKQTENTLTLIRGKSMA